MDFTGEIGDMPITLIVKAPNQRIADQNVECTLSWTIRKLKEHLQHVYPNKPKHNQQKLIYSGKLLEDNLTLKQVLRRDNESVNHTVHLVCSSLSDFTEESQNIEKSPSPKSVHTSLPTTESTMDGLRHRGTSLPPTNLGSSINPPSMISQYTNFPQNYMQQMYGQMPHMNGQMPQMYGGMPQMYSPISQMYGQMPQSSGYTPEQYNLMMQQMYSQYMNQYMQFYSNAAGMTPPPSPATPVVQEQAANRNAVNNRPANQNIRMNAQGGIVEDDDEDNENRDWLDFIYMMFRFLVLISIIYFYSTFTRSAAVLLVFFLIYLLQKGWLMIRRRERQEAVQPAMPNPNAQQQPDNLPDNNQENADSPSGEANSESTNEMTDNPNGTPPPPPAPGILATAWCFFTTFFSSLIPEQPVAVNQN